MEKSYEAIKLIGTLAVEKGWVSKKEVELAWEQQKPGEFFGEILLNKKLITPQQLNELLRLQQESKIRKEDFLFGQIAVHNQFVKAQDIINGIEEQKVNKKKQSLGSILIEKGLLNTNQCTAILTSQKRIQNLIKAKTNAISCPKCKTSFPINDPERYRKVRCKNCQYIFEIGSKEIEVTIEPELNANQDNSDYDQEESRSLIQYLKENDISPQTNLSDSTSLMISGNDRYILGDEIARGGMGSIVLTKDVNLRRNIVTKVLLNNKSKLATLRFIEEAQITGQLEHPNIPPVYDLGLNKNNKIFFTMKQIKGETLQNIINQLKSQNKEYIEKYSFNTIVNIFLKVCNALEFAHSKKVIHRDIKPENIMVGEYGEVLLMDWGIAKVIGTKEEIEELEGEKISSVRTEDESSHTIEGTTAGTPAFMSPEQASGHLEKLDQRSDIYSLGATLFNALSYEKPFKGVTVYELLHNVTEGKMQDLKGIFPSELKAIALKAMAFKQLDRYQSVKEMEMDLLNFQMGYSVSAKQDNVVDIMKKFYKRNKLLTITTLSFFIVFLVVSITFVVSLKKAVSKFEKEKSERISDNKSSAPTYFAKAQSEAQINNFEEAEKLMDTAISYDSENQNYRLYRGCLSFINNNIKKAIDDLALIKNHPFQININQILIVLNTPGLEKIEENQKAILAESCNNMKLFVIAQKLTSDLNKKIEIWNKKLKNELSTKYFTLSLVNNKLTFAIRDQNEILDYTPLKGLPIQSFNLINCKNFSDLSFIQYLAIEELSIYGTPFLSDLTPLKNCKLKYLKLWGTNVKDLSPLANSEINTLIIGVSPLTTIKPLLHQPIKDLTLIDIKLLDYDELKTLKLEKISFTYIPTINLNCLNTSQLKSVSIFGGGNLDISNLKDSPLNLLELVSTNATNFSLLENKNIKELNLTNSRIQNIEIIPTMKNLETIYFTPRYLPPIWEQIIIKMSSQIKKIGIDNSPSQIRTVEKFLEENQGVNINNPKK